jgi:hypothetical protein
LKTLEQGPWQYAHNSTAFCHIVQLGIGAKEGSKEAMNWREHLRILAILVNGFFALFLIGTRSWWMSMGLGVPMIVPPVLAVIALAVHGVRRG